MEKDKIIGKVKKFDGCSVEMQIFDKELQMLMKGYVIEYKPSGWFSKLFWRFIKFEVKYKEAPKLWQLLRKVKAPKVK